MRTALVAALLLVLASPAANAQMHAALDVQVKAPTDAVGPEGAKVEVLVTRVCPHPAMYMPDQVVRLEIQGPPGSLVDGPESVLFYAHPCLQQSMDEAAASFLVKLPADAPPATALRYSLQAQPTGGDPLLGYTDSAEADFQLVTPDAPEPEADAQDLMDEAGVTEEDVADAAQELEKASESGEVMDIPGASWLVAILGLGLAAMRRRVA